MALKVRGFRQQLSSHTKPLGAAAGDLKVVAIDEGNATGTRPWQAFNVIAVEVDSETKPTQIELVIRPIPGAHG